MEKLYLILSLLFCFYFCNGEESYKKSAPFKIQDASLITITLKNTLNKNCIKGERLNLSSYNTTDLDININNKRSNEFFFAKNNRIIIFYNKQNIYVFDLKKNKIIAKNNLINLGIKHSYILKVLGVVNSKIFIKMSQTPYRGTLTKEEFREKRKNGSLNLQPKIKTFIFSFDKNKIIFVGESDFKTQPMTPMLLDEKRTFIEENGDKEVWGYFDPNKIITFTLEYMEDGCSVDYLHNYGLLIGDTGKRDIYHPISIYKVDNDKKQSMQVANGICPKWGSNGDYYYISSDYNLIKANINGTKKIIIKYLDQGSNFRIYRFKLQILKKEKILLYSIYGYTAKDYQSSDRQINYIVDLKNKQYFQLKTNVDTATPNMYIRLIPKENSK